MQDLICHWPESPDLSPPGSPVLIRIGANSPRPQMRAPLRTVLRQVLAAWSGLPPGKLPLLETPRGPVWDGILQGHSLDISLSYEDTGCWIALRRAGLIGVDAMCLKPVPEAEAIAKIYFAPAICDALRQSRDPVRQFAIAWTQLEARCKCLKRGLTEWSESLAAQANHYAAESMVLDEKVVVSVATAPQPPG